VSVVHTVSQGQCLSSIARSYGFDDWRVIYNHPDNASFRQLRPNPNLIHPGDRIVIPDLDPGGEGAPTEQTHTFELDTDRVLLRVVVQDVDKQPMSGKRYKLTVDALPPVEGTTGGDGMVEQEIAPGAESGLLEVFVNGNNVPPVAWRLMIGHLDPVEQVSGYQARLNNLAFESGPVDGIKGPLTTGAVKRFQTEFALASDGIVGPLTRGKLRDVYGC
jgi:hypothetical protein